MTPHEAGEDLRPRFSDMRDDFISHHTESVGEGAVRLAKAMARRGRSSWLAQQKIKRTTLWNDDLLPAIENCAEFILMMNTPAMESPRVRGECIHALNHNRRVIAIELEPEMEPGKFDIGFLAVQVCVIKWHRRLETDDDAAQLADLIIRTLQAERDLLMQVTRRRSKSPSPG